MANNFTAHLDPAWLTRQRTTYPNVLAPKISVPDGVNVTPPLGTFVKVVYDAQRVLYTPSVHNQPPGERISIYGLVEDCLGQSDRSNVLSLVNLRGSYRIINTGADALAVGDSFYVSAPDARDCEAQLSCVKLARTEASCAAEGIPFFGGLFATKRLTPFSTDLISHRLKRDLDVVSKTPANAVPDIDTPACVFYMQMLETAGMVDAVMRPATRGVLRKFSNHKRGLGPAPNDTDVRLVMADATIRNLLCEGVDKMIAFYDSTAIGTYGRVLHSIHTPTPLYRTQVMLNNKMGKIDCGSAFQAYIYQFNGI